MTRCGSHKNIISLAFILIYLNTFLVIYSLWNMKIWNVWKFFLQLNCHENWKVKFLSFMEVEYLLLCTTPLCPVINRMINSSWNQILEQNPIFWLKNLKVDDFPVVVEDFDTKFNQNLLRDDPKSRKKLVLDMINRWSRSQLKKKRWEEINIRILVMKKNI